MPPDLQNALDTLAFHVRGLRRAGVDAAGIIDFIHEQHAELHARAGEDMRPALAAWFDALASTAPA